MISKLDKLKSALKSRPRLALLLPYIIIALLFIVLPFFILLVISLKPAAADFDNWKIVKDSSTWVIMWRSVWMGIVTALICLLLGFPYAFFVSTSKSKSFKFYAISLIISPLIIFTIAKALALRGMFTLLFDERKINSEWFMVLGMIYLNLPFMIIPLYSVFRDMNPNILEVSYDLGYNKFLTLIKVVLPYGIKAIFSGVGLVFLMAALSVIISDKLLSNGFQHQLIGNVINQHVNPSNPFDMARASTLVLITTIVLMSFYSLIYLVPMLVLKLKGINYD